MEGTIQTQFYSENFVTSGEFIVSQSQIVVKGKKNIAIQIIILIDRSSAVVCISFSGWLRQKHKVGSPGSNTEPCTSEKRVASTFGDWFY